MYAYSLVTYTK